TEKTGKAARVEATSKGSDWDVRAFAGATGGGFVNPSSTLDKGRSEAGVKGTLRLDTKTSVQAEGAYTDDQTGSTSRQAVVVNLIRDFEGGVRAEAGIRHSRDQLSGAAGLAGIGTAVQGSVTDTGSASTEPGTVNETPATPSLAAAAGGTSADYGTTDSVRARVTVPVPGLPQASAFVEGEQTLGGDGKRNLGLGGEWRVGEKTKLYGRHNLVSEIDSPFSATQTTATQRTLFGVQSDVLQGTSAYSEYRVQGSGASGVAGALDARSAEAVLGLRNQIQVTPDLRLSVSGERIESLDDGAKSAGPAGGTQGATVADSHTSTAATLGVEYTVNPALKTSARVEGRTSAAQDAALMQANVVARLSPEFAAIGRASVDATRSDGASAASAGHLRLQAGLAWRDLETNKLSALGKLEYRDERQSGGTQAAIDSRTWIASFHANYQADPAVGYALRVAAKSSEQDSEGIRSEQRALLVSGRWTYDITRMWDVGVTGSLLVSGVGLQHGLGVEAGLRLANNLRVGVGLNVFGFRDKDLTDQARTSQGLFVTLRYKFDEGVFGWLNESKAVERSPGPVDAVVPSAAASETQ
ncbi:MAG: hypothetical protein JWP52_2178, partial [Rhizobacter sp.]|nr:hypothetical protein [Rhizobacter sp.]